MNRKLVFALAAILAASAAACSTYPKTRFDLAPVKANGQDLVGLDGATTIESRQPGGIVSVRADNAFAEFGASLIVAVQNKSGGVLDFGPQNISATANGQVLKVLAADELDAQSKAQARGFLRATTRTGEVGIEQATGTFNREYRFNNYGGCPAGQGDCQAFAEDGGSGYRQDRINRELEASNVAVVAQQLESNRALISQKALRPASVAPEQIAGGVVVVHPPKAGGRVDIVVTFNGQKHSFSFNAQPAA
ncbi:MAG: hypothetical protein Q8R02_19860 [Hyphomonadaceae bacterium]|nr:hypothetical protein [Hyphomonadaceae bacterium]